MRAFSMKLLLRYMNAQWLLPVWLACSTAFVVGLMTNQLCRLKLNSGLLSFIGAPYASASNICW